MTSGGQCVMTTGTALMLLWFASSWDMLTLEVRVIASQFKLQYYQMLLITVSSMNLSLRMHAYLQVAGLTAMRTLEEVMGQSSWMMFSAAQVLTSY